MGFVRTWLIPRVAFWIVWTVWLWCLQSFLLDEWKELPPYLTLVLVVGPPLLFTGIGSRLAKNPLDSPSTLFWKGATVSCLLGVFANVALIKQINDGVELLIGATLLCGYMAIRPGGVNRIEVKQGVLFERVQAIARWTGVSVGRVIVFTTPRNSPSAFAHRMGAILLSDRLVRILSQREADAVIAHEAAHLRPNQKLLIALAPLTAAILVPIASFWPNVMATAPFWPIIAVLMWRALRRMQEYDADATAIRILRDPESLITALARLSSTAGLPLHWGRAAGIFISHPPMTARFRSIARKAGLSSSRVDELVEMASEVPAMPGYISPFEE